MVSPFLRKNFLYGQLMQYDILTAMHPATKLTQPKHLLDYGHSALHDTVLDQHAVLDGSDL